MMERDVIIKLGLVLVILLIVIGGLFATFISPILSRQKAEKELGIACAYYIQVWKCQFACEGSDASDCRKSVSSPLSAQNEIIMLDLCKAAGVNDETACYRKCCPVKMT